MKKFLTFVLVLAMVMSVSSFAMAVNSQSDLQDAINAAPENTETTITLTGSVTVSADSCITVPDGKVIVLDLAGYTISQAQTAFNSMTLKNEGTLTITDSVGGGKITSTYTGVDDSTYSNGVYTVQNFGVMTVTNVTIENLTTVSPLMRSALENRSASRDVSLTLGAGSVVRCPEYIAMRQWITSTTYKNDIIIDGGTVEGGRRGIWMQLPSTDASQAFKASLTVKSGIVTSNDESDNAIYLYSYGNSNNNVEINISGGTINGNIGLLGGAGKNNGKPTVSISGGSMTSVEDYSGNLTGIISGGEFAEKPAAALIDTNKVAVGDDDGEGYVIGEKSNDSVAIDVTPASLDFGSETVGYAAPAAKKIIVTNIGTSKVYVSQPTDNDYTVTIASGDLELDPSEAVEFNVVPETGLSAGQHNATFSINASDYSDSTNASATTVMKQVAVSFTVNTKPSSGSGISVKYNGGNSFSTSNPSVPTGVEIDGVPVTFNGTGSNFTVGCISSDAKWVTVRWNSTSVTTNFTPDGLVECTTVNIPKTGDMSFWAAVAAFFGL